MPKHIRYGLQVGKGLPSDEDIRAWRDKLALCISALEADFYYDRYMANSYLGSDEEWAEYYDGEESQLLPYRTAIAALDALVAEPIAALEK